MTTRKVPPLTAATQSILDAMRKGWQLTYSPGTGNHPSRVWLQRGRATQTVDARNVGVLVARQIIKDVSDKGARERRYHLTG